MMTFPAFTGGGTPKVPPCANLDKIIHVISFKIELNDKLKRESYIHLDLFCSYPSKCTSQFQSFKKCKVDDSFEIQEYSIS